ncbi:hypothetical protein M758_4G002000 [Ceratodon purpureus]|nr:hypothetical protein M758_4G002000 [Ceratodon purpureus]
MKELSRAEASDILEGTEDRVSGASLEELMSREDSPTTSGMRCWQGEVEVEDRWGISSPTSRSEGGAPSDRPSGALEKSKSRLHGSRRSLHRAGRRVFSCFRHSTISLTVPDLEPSTPPKSGPLTAPRKSASGASGVTFMHEAAGHRHHVDNDEDLDTEEPTSPVVNCMGQVRPKEKQSKKIEAPPREIVDDREKFRRTKSQAPPRSPPMVSKSKSCKWKQLLRSNSSSISPSNHPCGSEGEPEIDLGRFSSASGSSDLFYRQAPGASHPEKLPDKTCLLMRRNSTSGSNPINESHDSSENTLKLLQEQLDLRNSGNVEDEHRKAVAESEPVFRNLPSLKTTRIESPKWFADEPVVNKRQGLLKPSRMDSQTLKGSSTSLSHI